MNIKRASNEHKPFSKIRIGGAFLIDTTKMDSLYMKIGTQTVNGNTYVNTVDLSDGSLYFVKEAEIVVEVEATVAYR